MTRPKSTARSRAKAVVDTPRTGQLSHSPRSCDFTRAVDR